MFQFIQLVCWLQYFFFVDFHGHNYLTLTHTHNQNGLLKNILHADNFTLTELTTTRIEKKTLLYMKIAP